MRRTDCMVPGIHGLLQGERWPQGTSPLIKPMSSRLKLDSFQKSGFKELCEAASDKLASLPFSPATTCCPMQSPREQKHCRDIDRPQSLRSVTVEPSSSVQALESLHMPKCATITHGGWLDTRNWLFDMLWKEVCDKSLEELHKIFFTREARPEYGETHAVTRRSKPHGKDDVDTLLKASKDISKENHGKQERERRGRHRFFQREADNRTPTSTYEMSRRILPEVKEEVKKTLTDSADDDSTEPVSSRKSRGACSSDKVAGKDDQLLAAVLTQDLASIIVLREYDARVTIEKRLASAEAARQEEQACRIRAEEQAHQLELENKHVCDEMAYLRCRHVDDEQSRREPSGHFTQPQLPPPSTIQKRKRTMDDTDHLACSTTYSPSSRQSSKRQHLTIEQGYRSDRSHNQTLLPPSPTPSCDACLSSFCSV